MSGVVVDEDLCIGCGQCEEICPAVFFLDEEIGKSRVIDPEACEFVGCCEAAAENCPVDAITVTEEAD
jgi:ferredoxin